MKETTLAFDTPLVLPKQGKFLCLSGFIAVCLISMVLSNRASAFDVLTQHNDQWRTGTNTSETTLTPSNVNQAQFGSLFSYSVDGSVYAQPLFVADLSISGGTHNVVFVATMENSVYAFDADSNVTYWHVSFNGSNTTPVPISDITGNNNLNIHGNVGVLSTPVIDRSSGTIYILSRTKNTSSVTYHQHLHALDISTGAEKLGGAKEISAAGFDPRLQSQRPGLALGSGNVYIAWGSHEDRGAYHGWVMSYNATTLAQVAVFNDTPGGNGGAFWQAGQAPAIDQNGNLYLISGNGDWNGSSKFGQAFLKLSPGLSVLDWFTPSNFASLNFSDADFGSAGALLLPSGAGYPSTQYVIGGGKEGKLFVLDKNNSMGHEDPTDSGAHQIWQAVQTAACSHHIHGSPVYWDSASEGQVIYVWGENDVGKGFKFDGTTFQTSPFSTTAAKSPSTGCGMPGSMLSLSANGNSSGILWANCVFTGDALHNTVSGIMRAYDANNLGKELWNSRMNQSRDDIGNFAKYVCPTVADGRVYMATFSGKVNVYGLLAGSGGSGVADGTYKIISRNSGKALDVNLASTADGAQVDQFTYTGATNQKWIVTSLGNNEFSIIGVGSGKSLDVASPGTANGTKIEILPYNASNNQTWILTATDSGFFRISPVTASGSCLDVKSHSTANSALVELFTYRGANNQQWAFQAP